METETAFDGASFLGLARTAKRDPYRLALLARQLDPGEAVRAVLPVPGGTLLVTDRRAIELRAHLEVDGAWNVREFQGYVVSREVFLEGIRKVRRRTGPADASREVDDVLQLETLHGEEEILLSRGPAPVLTPEEFDLLASFLSLQAK